MNAHQQILPAVAAAIFNEQGKILLQKRRDVQQWGLISGHVEFGGSIENALLREIQEETNTAASIVRCIRIYSSPASQIYACKDRTVQYITSYFEARLNGGIVPGYCNSETAALQFFPPGQLPADLAPMHPAWLSDALANQKKIFIR